MEEDRAGEHKQEHEPLQPDRASEGDGSERQGLPPERRALESDRDRKGGTEKGGKECVVAHEVAGQEQRRDQERHETDEDRIGPREQPPCPQVQRHRPQRDQHRVDRLRDLVRVLSRGDEPGRRYQHRVQEAEDPEVLAADIEVGVIRDALRLIREDQLVDHDPRADVGGRHPEAKHDRGQQARGECEAQNASAAKPLLQSPPSAPLDRSPRGHRR